MVNGSLEIDVDTTRIIIPTTGILVVTLVTFMMATGPVKMEHIPECGTTLKDPLLVLKESGEMSKVEQLVHGPQILSIHLSDTSWLKT